MSGSRDDSESKKDEILSGCDTVKILWDLAIKQCRIDKPGVAGSRTRLKNNVVCSNIDESMRIASLKCWHERTAYGATNPNFLFEPPFNPPKKENDLHDDESTVTQKNNKTNKR